MSEDVEDDMTWLRYWVILAVVSMVEVIVDPLVDFFPGYLIGKCAFLIWCMAPLENNGVSFIFTQVTLSAPFLSNFSTSDNISTFQETLSEDRI